MSEISLEDLASRAVAAASKRPCLPPSPTTRTHVKRQKSAELPSLSKEHIRVGDLVLVDVENKGIIQWDFGIVTEVDRKHVKIEYLWEPKTVARALNDPGIIRRNEYFLGLLCAQEFPRDEILHVLAPDSLQIAGTFDDLKGTVQWGTSVCFPGVPLLFTC